MHYEAIPTLVERIKVNNARLAELAQSLLRDSDRISRKTDEEIVALQERIDTLRLETYKAAMEISRR